MEEVTFGGVVFVVFKSQESTMKMRKFYSTEGIWGKIKWMFVWIKTCRPYKWDIKYKTSTSEKKWVYVHDSPEPADIIWENVCLGFWYKVFFRGLTYLVVAALLVGSYFLNLLIYSWKKSVVKDLANLSYSQQINGRILTIVASLLLIITNKVMEIISIKLTLLEGHYTYTRYGFSVAYKLVLVKSINVGIIPLMNNLEYSLWFADYGLIEDCFFNILFFILGESLFTVIDVE